MEKRSIMSSTGNLKFETKEEEEEEDEEEEESIILLTSTKFSFTYAGGELLLLE